MNRLFATVVFPCVLTVMLHTPCIAQNPFVPGQDNTHGITGSGTATIDCPTQRMRMYVDLTGRGADVRKAAAALKDRIEVAKATVKSHKAVTDSIEVGDPKIDAAASQMHAVLRQRLQEGFNLAGRSPDETKTQTLVTVTAQLTAEWDFTGVDHLELLATTHELQQKLRDAKLSGRDDKAGLSPEARELLEEASMMGEIGEQPSGDPMFLFIGNVTPEQEKAALKEAVDLAKQQAAGLAEAAGVKLGTLQSLSRTSKSTVAGYNEYGADYGGSSYQAYQLASQIQSAATKPSAVGIAPGKLSYQLVVTVGYEIAD